jgi:hypothetical protein
MALYTLIVIIILMLGTISASYSCCYTFSEAIHYSYKREIHDRTEMVSRVPSETY